MSSEAQRLLQDWERAQFLAMREPTPLRRILAQLAWVDFVEACR